MKSTSQSHCNTGPLFKENGQHWSQLKEQFIIGTMGALDSAPRSTKGLCSALLKCTRDNINILLMFFSLQLIEEEFI